MNNKISINTHSPLKVYKLSGEVAAAQVCRFIIHYSLFNIQYSA